MKNLVVGIERVLVAFSGVCKIVSIVARCSAISFSDRCAVLPVWCPWVGLGELPWGLV
jgi:hypothetical protein